MKHNKKRNTAFIYEVLTKELTKTIVNNDADKKANIITILKEHFIQGSPLAEQLNLYNILLKKGKSNFFGSMLQRGYSTKQRQPIVA